MKKHFASFVFFLLIATAACALAAPKLTNVTAESDSLRAGGEWALTFETTEGGALAMSLRGADGESIELGATQVDGFFDNLPSVFGEIFAGNMVAGVFVVGLILEICLPKDISKYEI